MYVWYFVFFFLGLFSGSLVNVIAGGLTREPRRYIISSCRQCESKWPLRYMLPVVGFFLSRGRCNACGGRLKQHICIVELATGLLFSYFVYRFGLSWELSLAIIYSLLLLIILVTDIEKMLIPNVVTYPGLVMVLLLSATIMLLGVHPSWVYIMPVSGILEWLNNYLINAIAGCGTGFFLLLAIAIISRGGMGLGDVKLAALIGLMVGFPVIIVSLFISIMLGGLMAIILLLARRKGRKDPVPFGPFLCAGGIITMLWGKDLLGWYLSPLM